MVGKNQSRQAQRLSSGLRINSAADDAAGLAISEKMRAQIRGLTQAEHNTQDGIALIQVAEGGLNEVHEILQRMRQLSLQSANDTNMDENRTAIQYEIDQLKLEIDDIAVRTQYNGISLLQGEFGRIASGNSIISPFSSFPLSQIQQAVLDKLGNIGTGGWIDSALDHIRDVTGLELLTNVNLNIQFSNLPSGILASMSSSGDGVTYTMTFNNRFIAELNPNFSAGTPPVLGGIHLHSLVTHELMHMVEANNFLTTNSHPDSRFVPNIPIWFTEGIAEAVHGGTNLWFADNVSEAEVIRQLTAIRNNPNRLTRESYSAGSLVVLQMEAMGGIDTFFDNLRISSNFETAMQATFGMSSHAFITQMINDISANGLDGFAANLGTTRNGLFGDTFGLGGAGSTGIPPGYGSSPNPPEGGGGTFSFGTTMNLHLQVGANAGQSFNISIDSISSDTLLVRPIDLTSRETSEAAIDILDIAITDVSRMRADLGAQQNRLEHIVRNLAISAENLSSAESRIRDADMAKEMMKFTQSNVLQQAAVSMLAQGNQAPQSLLQLLR